MCTSPITRNESTFACRRCDACVANRRNGWVKRAMMEKTLWPHCMVIALTYADDTQWQRDGAAMFRYQDVKAFLDRLRSAISYATDAKSTLRFIAAGEQGDRNGRCHWHLVLFSDFDFLTLGEFTAPWGVVKKREEIISDTGKPYRRGWSLWGHGFVTVQHPDEGGMFYALSYALKDQFNVSKTKGTKRHAKAENFGTGKFRMSKAPPIGHVWVEQQIAAYRARLNVLPELRFRVPETEGYWFPTGTIRHQVLDAMAQINHECRRQNRRDARAWSTLLHSLRDMPADLERLLDGQDEDETSLEFQIQARGREQASKISASQIARRCGSVLPCNDCLRGQPETWSGLGIHELVSPEGQIHSFQYFGHESNKQVLKDQQRSGGACNALCLLRTTPSRRRVFLNSAGT